MPTGRVKSYSRERSFGFIAPVAGGSDVFVHADAIASDESLRPGDLVEFELGEEDDGKRAVDVQIVERAPEDNPAGRVVAGGAPPTWDELERIDREQRTQRRHRRRRR